MAHKNLDDIELFVSPLTGEVYIGQIRKDRKGNTLSSNKKVITQEFKNCMMKFFDLNEDQRWQESMVGEIEFTPKSELL